jgi:hypothetical protein
MKNTNKPPSRGGSERREAFRAAPKRDTSNGSAYHATATGLPVRTDWHSL